MSIKEIKVGFKKYRDLILLMIPLAVATVIVAWELVPAELLGMFGDAYTVALLFTLLLVTMLAARKRASRD